MQHFVLPDTTIAIFKKLEALFYYKVPVARISLLFVTLCRFTYLSTQVVGTALQGPYDSINNPISILTFQDKYTFQNDGENIIKICCHL